MNVNKCYWPALLCFSSPSAWHSRRVSRILFCCRSTYSRTGRYSLSVCLSKHREIYLQMYAGVWIRTQDPRVFQDQRPTAFNLCRDNLREVSSFLPPFFLLLFFVFFYSFYIIISLFFFLSYFLLFLFVSPFLSSHFRYFVVQTSNPVSASRTLAIFIEILQLQRCHFGSYCTILFRIISSVIVSKCFIGFCPRSFILCSSYPQFLWSWGRLSL
jgi:hypothetical protein